jgi:uncharacterized membrane protein
MEYIILALFYFLFPILVLYLANKYSIVNKIGAVVICYGMGLLVGNIGVMPEGMEDYQFNLQMVIVPLAIPLLLFALDIRKWIRLAGKTFLSLVLGLVSVIIMVVLGFYIYREVIPDIWKVGGVLVGFYSGGAPNAAAIKLIVGMEQEVYMLTQTYDIAVGAVTLLFLMTIAQRFFLLFMRPYEVSDKEDFKDTRELYHEKYESYTGIFDRKIFPSLLGSLGLSAIILALMAGISILVFDGIDNTLIILGITTLGIAASFVPRIKNIEKSFQGGIYLIMVFCVIVASGADISMFSLESVPILVYVVLVVPGALIVHGILSKIFNVDADNFLIISVALSMSPAFVPVVAASLRNRDIILPGLVIGIVGYAVGNYLGAAMAELLRVL